MNGEKMANIDDVRKALYNAYKMKEAKDGGIEGKSGEAECCLYYPKWWDCESIEDFQKPCGLMVYSYALGPSREHYFNYAKMESHPNYYTWNSPDFFQKAIDVINSLVNELDKE